MWILNWLLGLTIDTVRLPFSVLEDVVSVASWKEVEATKENIKSIVDDIV